jgi:hypothetical protein
MKRRKKKPNHKGEEKTDWKQRGGKKNVLEREKKLN